MTDSISINGALTDKPPLPLDTLLSANFVWQMITVFGRRVVKAEWAVEVVQRAYNTLYGDSTHLTAPLLEQEVKALLNANGLPERGGAVVSLYLFPGGMRVLSCERQLAWREFSHQTGLRAESVSYDAPFDAIPSAAALAAHTCALAMARRTGSDIALHEVAGQYVSAGQWPLFAVTGGTPEQRGRIIAPPTCDSVQRRLGLAACRAAGLTVAERPLPAAEVATLEELFAVTPSGIASIFELPAAPTLSHSLAARIVAHLK